MRPRSGFGFLLILLTAQAWASPRFGPFGSPRHPVTHEVRAQARPPPPEDETFFRVSWEFYRAVLTPIDGPRCRHRPTCSLYGLQAVRRHGLVGMLLTLDRLLRAGESSAVRALPLVPDGESFRVLDPVEASTFWFTSSSRP